MTGRILIMLVVLTAMVATRQPATLAVAPVMIEQQTRSTWTDRLAVGLSRSMTRSALLQRIAFDVPKSPLTPRLDLDTRPVQQELPDPFRFCLPPPKIALIAAC